MKEDLLILSFAVAIALGILLVKIKKKQAKKSLPDDIPVEDDFIFVEYKGTVLCMRYLEKLEFWDNMTRQERRHQVDITNEAVGKGKLVAVKTPTNKIAYVDPILAKRKNWPIVTGRTKKKI